MTVAKRFWTRLVSMLLVTVMMLSVMPIEALAESLHGGEKLVAAEKASKKKEDNKNSSSLTSEKLSKFTAGYAYVKAGTRLYEKSNLKKQVERIDAKSVIYAFSYSENHNSVRIAYVDGKKVQYAWVDAERLSFMKSKDAKNYKKQTKSEFKYKGNPLVVTSLKSNEVAKPTKKPTPTPAPKKVKQKATKAPTQVPENVLAAEAVRALLDALAVPKYTEKTLWKTLDKVIAAKKDALDAYLAEIDAALKALYQLEGDARVAVNNDYKAVLTFIQLLPVKVRLDAAVTAYYREFDGELWVLFETMMALMTAEEKVACALDLEKLMAAIDAIPGNGAKLLKEQYAKELAFLRTLAEELKAMDSVGKADKSWFNFDWTKGEEFGYDYYNIISEKHYGLTPGADEAEIVLNNGAASRRQVVHVFKVDGEQVEVLPGYYGIDKYLESKEYTGKAEDPAWKDSWKTAGVTKVTKYYDETLDWNNDGASDWDVVGGMNIALAYDSNAPYGFFVYEGVVIEDQKGNPDKGIPAIDNHTGGNVQTYLAIDWDGNFELRSASTPLTGNERFAVGANFAWLVKDGVLQSKTPERTTAAAARSMLGILPSGELIMCMVDGRGANNSVGLSNYEMGEIMLALGCVNAVNGDGGGSSNFVSKREGETALTQRAVPCDGAERETLNSVIVAKKAGMKPGTFHHVNIQSDYDYFVPGSIYTFGLQAIDTTGAPMDLTEEGEWSLSDSSFGTITQGKFVSNGKIGEVAIQYTVKGTTAKKTINIVNPTTLKFPQEETVIPYGKSIQIEVVSLDSTGENTVFVDGNAFDWAVSDDAAGTLEDSGEGDALKKYTATEDEKIEGVTITATYKYGEKPVLTLKVAFGKGSEIVGVTEGKIGGWNFEDGTTNGFMGFTAAKAWSIANGVNNTLVGDSPLAGQFNEQINLKTFPATRSNGQVKNGNYSLGVEMDFTDATFGNWSYNVLFYTGEKHVFRDTANGKNATTLGMWLYIPEGAAGLSFQSQLWNGTGCVQDHFMFTTVSGVTKNLNSATEEDIPANRWVYASIDISRYPYLSTMDPTETAGNTRSPSFTRSYIKPMNAQKLTFYIDDITLDYSSAVDDRVAPVVSNVSYAVADEAVELEDGAQIKASALTFTAKIEDKNAGLDVATAQIYVDGVKVATETTGSGLITLHMTTPESVKLENGLHVVTFEVADRSGNRVQEQRTFTINASEEQALVYMEGRNDSGELAEYDSLYYVDLKTSNVENVKYVEAKIRLNTANKWEFEGLTAADGFELEYDMLDDNRAYNDGLSAQAKSNMDVHGVENVVHVKLTKKDDCVLTGEQTLLTLPVRIWSWDGVDNVTEKPIDPDAQLATGYWPIVRIEVNVLYGAVTTDADETIAFNGSISEETRINDNTNDDTYTPIHKHDEKLTVLSKPATCTADGYENRTYCETCKSVVDWGTKLLATGHNYVVTGEQLVCDFCSEVLNETGVVTVGEDKYYLIAGKLMTGWQSFGAEGYCYADPTTKKIYADCEFVVNGLIYTANEEGLMLGGAWHEGFLGRRYSYGPGYYSRVWVTIDGEEYYFAQHTGYAYTGYKTIPDNRNDPKAPVRWYHFAADGKLIERMKHTGVVDTGEGLYYMEEGIATYAGLVKVGNDYYCVNDKYGTVLTGRQWVGSYLVSISKNPLPAGYYEFGADGKMLQGVVEKEDGTYYFVDGKPQDAGWVAHNGHYYVFTNGGKALVGKHWVDSYLTQNSKDPYKSGTFIFDKTGRLANGIVYLADGSYYCENGVAVNKGLIKMGNDYYYAQPDGTLATGRIWVGTYPSHGLLPCGYYEFDMDGKMLNGVVEKNDGVYYYMLGKPVDTGWLKVGNDYYVFTNGGKALIGKQWIGTYLTRKSKDPLAVGSFVFGSDGKLQNGIAELEGGLYYFKGGVTKYLGLIKDNDNYYYVNEGGKLEIGRVWVGTYASNGLMKAAYREFMPTGEMANSIIEKADGMYLYEMGVPTDKGVTVYNGEYYYVADGGKLQTGRVYVGTYDAHGIVKNGYYEFGADGAMLNGFEQLEDGLYYYTMGRAQYIGLKIIDSDLDYINEGGKVEIGRVWVGTYASNGLIPAGYYTFDEEGKLIK